MENLAYLGFLFLQDNEKLLLHSVWLLLYTEQVGQQVVGITWLTLLTVLTFGQVSVKVKDNTTNTVEDLHDQQCH
jgi:hypothetical protein